ncbi:unnamed protein product [Rhodiola kirilowii]
MEWLLLLSAILFLIQQSESRLSADYYSKSCPQFTSIIQQTITDKQIKSPSTAAATLRLFFHDCLPNGCDASVLISSTPFNKAERDADINLSLPGDGFDVVVRAKTLLELTCPNVVSCADILTATTRDLVRMVGGPFYNVRFGRRDGVVSRSSSVQSLLPKPTMSMSDIISIFQSRKFTIREMVALTGAHTIGFSHCKEFINQISNSTYNARFASALRNACSDYKNNPTLSVFNDIMTPNKFDNMYFQNLEKGLGLLSSDHGLISDARTRPYAVAYAKNQDQFFRDFGLAMEKLSNHGVITGRRGEIRRRCDQVN